MTYWVIIKQEENKSKFKSQFIFGHEQSMLRLKNDNVNLCALYPTHFSANDHAVIIGCKKKNNNIQTLWKVL